MAVFGAIGRSLLSGSPASTSPKTTTRNTKQYAKLRVPSRRDSMQGRVLESFAITGRGTVVALDGVSDLPVGRKLSAKVERPDGSVIEAAAYKEWLLRRAAPPSETEAFLLLSVEKADVPEGSIVTLAVD